MNPAADRVHVAIPYRMLAEEYLPGVLEAGLHVELGMDAASLDGYGVAHMRKTARALREHGRRVSLHAPFLDLAPGALDPLLLEATRRRYEVFLSRAALFGPVSVVFHTGWDRMRYGFVAEEWYARCTETTAWFLEGLCRETDAVLAVENVFERGPGMLCRIVDALDSPRAGFCLDTGHMNVFSNLALEDWLAALGGRLFEVHVHDNTGAADEHLAVGRGDIAWPALFAALEKEARTPVVTCEAHTAEGVFESLAFLSRFF